MPSAFQIFLNDNAVRLELDQSFDRLEGKAGRCAQRSLTKIIRQIFFVNNYRSLSLLEAFQESKTSNAGGSVSTMENEKFLFLQTSKTPKRNTLQP